MGFIVYSIENENIHCLDPKEEPLRMRGNIKY